MLCTQCLEKYISLENYYKPIMCVQTLDLYGMLLTCNYICMYIDIYIYILLDVRKSYIYIYIYGEQAEWLSF